jgi:glycosyltransferase involved in cell wall biosynthesis
VKSTRNYVDSVLVCDGGSTDKTAELATKAGAWVHVGKLGLGNNLRGGLKAASDLKADVIVLLDGDGQHNPKDIPLLLEHIVKHDADIVVGNRFINPDMPGYRQFGNGLLSSVFNLGSHQKCPDAMSGFWAIRANAIPQLKENGWGIYVELLEKARTNGFRLMCCPIHTIYHSSYKDNSTLSPSTLGVILLWSILKWRLKCEVLRVH